MSNLIEQLPTLGVGASLSLSAKPDPISLVQSRLGPSFVEYAGLADVDQVIEAIDRIRSAGVPVLFHPSYINFCGSYSNSRHWLEATAAHIEKVGSPWFAQDCAYCFWEEGPGYDFVLSKYIETGVEELDQEKLPILLTNKYQSLEDAKAVLGETSLISSLFIEFQKYLYMPEAA